MLFREVQIMDLYVPSLICTTFKGKLLTKQSQKTQGSFKKEKGKRKFILIGSIPIGPLPQKTERLSIELYSP